MEYTKTIALEGLIWVDIVDGFLFGLRDYGEESLVLIFLRTVIWLQSRAAVHHTIKFWQESAIHFAFEAAS